MWHLRGGLTREEAWTLSPTEREELWEQVNERVELVKSTGMNVL